MVFASTVLHFNYSNENVRVYVRDYKDYASLKFYSEGSDVILFFHDVDEIQKAVNLINQQLLQLRKEEKA